MLHTSTLATFAALALSCSGDASSSAEAVASTNAGSEPPTLVSDGETEPIFDAAAAEEARVRELESKGVFEEDLQRGQTFEDVHETGTVQVRETSLGKIGEGYFPKHTVVSEDGTSVAWVRLDNDNSGVFRNGERIGESFKLFGTTGVVLSRDGQRVAYTTSSGSLVKIRLDGDELPGDYLGVSQNGLVFSPDGARFGFVAATDEGQFATIDGQRGPVFDGISSHGIVFSPDSTRVAHAGTKDEAWHVVLDGELNGPWQAVGNQGVVFSADSLHVAFAARRDNTWFVVHDGKEFGPYTSVSALTFAPVGGRFAFNAEIEKKRAVLVVDGEVSEEHEQLQSDPTFTADGTKLAYSVSDGETMRVVFEGASGPEFDRMSRKGRRRILVSDDGQHVAYVGKRDKARLVVVDGETVGEHGSLFQRTLQFFPGSTDLLYVTSRNQNTFVQARGEEYGPYPRIVQESEFISPDGSSFAFAVRDGRRQRYLRNGEPGDDYAYLYPKLHTFTDDGHLVYVGRRGKDSFPIVHRQGRGPVFTEVPKSSTFSRSADGNPQFIALRGDEFFLVEVLPGQDG